MPSTPEPPETDMLPRTPGAPRYGPMYDGYEPFAPRKSARVAQRVQRAQGTPPPAERSDEHQDPLMASPPTTVKKDLKDPLTNDLISTPSAGKLASRGMVTGSFDLTRGGSRIKTKSEGKSQSKNTDTVMAGTESTLRNGMLPTPAKTPSSNKTVVEAGSINSVARNLFPHSRPAAIDEVMPSPKKKGRKKVNGFEITSDVEEEVPIKIYTDSKDRIPEIDDNEDNPFYDNPDKPEKPSKLKSTARTKRRKVERAGVAEHTYGDETMGANSAVFTFRGKKFLHSLEEKDYDRVTGTDDAELEAELDALVPAHLAEPLNSAPFKGKWLFGEHPRKAEANEEEETDIDEKSHKKAGRNLKSDKTPANSKVRATTPPRTTRVTRAQKLSLGLDGAGARDDEVTLHGGARGRGRSRGGSTIPFDHWTRTRSPLDEPGSLGSPVRKTRPRPRMTTRSGGRASTSRV